MTWLPSKDWPRLLAIIVAVLWLIWLIYLCYTTLEWWRGGLFDPMPVLAGPAVLLIMPRAYATDIMADLIERMNGAYLIDFGDALTKRAFKARFEAWNRRLGVALAIAVSGGLVVSVLYYYEARLVGLFDVQVHPSLSRTEMFLLIAVMLLSGLPVGYFLGRFCGNGLLPFHLARANVPLRRPVNVATSLTLFAGLRRAYLLAFVACGALMLWFATWIGLFYGPWTKLFGSEAPWAALFGFDGLNDWAKPFTGLWALTFSIFTLGVTLPVVSWHRRVEALRDGVAQDRPDGLPGPWLGGGLLNGGSLAAMSAVNAVGIAAAIAMAPN